MYASLMSDPAFKLINQSSQGTLILCLALTSSLEESTSLYHLCSPTATHLHPSGWHCLTPPHGAAHLPIQGLQGVPRAVTYFSSAQGQGLLLLLCSNSRGSAGRWDSLLCRVLTLQKIGIFCQTVGSFVPLRSCL